MAAASTSTASVSLKEYLKRYESGAADDPKKKKKKKKNPNPNSLAAGVLVVDEDPVWQKPVELQENEDDDNSAGEDAPQVDEDIEVKRMKRLEAIRSRKPYLAVSDDGSGWVSISDRPKVSNQSDGGSDLSPPRQRRPRLDTPSPDRDQRLDDSKNGGLSPPRQRRRRFDSPSPEPQTRTHDSGNGVTDLSPPRRKPIADHSPPRRARHRSPEDLSPPRRTRYQRPKDDLSPPRGIRKGPSDDLSPPRRKMNPSVTKEADLSPPRRRKEPSVVKEVRRTGLLSAEEIRKEIDKKKKEELSRFASMDPAMSGRGAQPVFRDKEGKRVSKEEILKSQEEEKPKEKKIEWGKGLAQKREAEARAEELELEKDKPFARTRDDPELDKMLKERIRWGDPMAHLVKSSETVLEDLGNDERMKESGFIIPQTIPSHSWIKRGIDFPPNRYGIRPGRHWDGVDRSNGYEKELFKRQNDKRATEAEAYLWSVSDM